MEDDPQRSREQIQLLQRRQLSKLLPVGFGFRPTDAELVNYYLRRKIDGSLRHIDQFLVPEVEVYNCEPWELPGKSLFQSGDLVWHFFSPKNRMYPGSLHYNRTTKHGLWVLTGKERDIVLSPGSMVIGKKRTLIFYEHPRAEKDISNIWAIHEYRTTNDQDDFVLCRLLQKPVQILLPNGSPRHENMVPSHSSCVTTNDAEKRSLNAKLTSDPNKPAMNAFLA